jgi:hypothetical protein
MVSSAPRGRFDALPKLLRVNMRETAKADSRTKTTLTNQWAATGRRLEVAMKGHTASPNIEPRWPVVVTVVILPMGALVISAEKFRWLRIERICLVFFYSFRLLFYSIVLVSCSPQCCALRLDFPVSSSSSPVSRRGPALCSYVRWRTGEWTGAVRRVDATA